jgi:hypothetical protein
MLTLGSALSVDAIPHVMDAGITGSTGLLAPILGSIATSMPNSLGMATGTFLEQSIQILTQSVMAIPGGAAQAVTGLTTGLTGTVGALTGAIGQIFGTGAEAYIANLMAGLQ